MKRAIALLAITVATMLVAAAPSVADSRPTLRYGGYAADRPTAGAVSFARTAAGGDHLMACDTNAADGMAVRVDVRYGSGDRLSIRDDRSSPSCSFAGRAPSPRGAVEIRSCIEGTVIFEDGRSILIPVKCNTWRVIG